MLFKCNAQFAGDDGITNGAPSPLFVSPVLFQIERIDTRFFNKIKIAKNTGGCKQQD
ncbi:hypothetical protein [Treponema denticola]|uniref:hypothetical protein n=1 Tax=Treponema denticola TaxID=158 RepID=UPI003D8FE5C2